MESNSRIVYVCNRPLQYNNRISDEANDRKVAMVTKYMNRLEAVAALQRCHIETAINLMNAVGLRENCLKD